MLVQPVFDRHAISTWASIKFWLAVGASELRKRRSLIFQIGNHFVNSLCCWY
uniref:Uncharacterized protein n=1 Tax=Anguilla anguilla TaxID=7936 RepID=A0A0E9URF5_ANGAN